MPVALTVRFESERKPRSAFERNQDKRSGLAGDGDPIVVAGSPATSAEQAETVTEAFSFARAQSRPTRPSPAPHLLWSLGCIQLKGLPEAATVWLESQLGGSRLADSESSAVRITPQLHA